ncbi:MAG TPA: hypothetical protein VHU40_19805 [Polyangia bacterium]|nr:hypothetical protein [Polyangia bacterium]
MTAASPIGCSYLFVSAPPDNHERLYEFDCTTGNVLPVVDGVIATVYGIGTVGMIADKSEQPSTVATLAVAVAAFGASSVLGFQRTKDCRAARAQLSLRLDALRRSEPPAVTGRAGDWAPPPGDPWLDPGPATPSRFPANDNTPVAPEAPPAGTNHEPTQAHPKED